MLEFIKTWTLPIAMITGALVYLIFAGTPMLNPLKPAIYGIIDIILPTFIFIMLFVTFCKVTPKQLRIKRWHLMLLSIQIVGCLVFYFALRPLSEVIAQAVMVCFICPTATAAAVITDKLGGSIANVTTYTLLSNLLAAIAIPTLFPLVEPQEGINFIVAFTIIFKKLFYLIICPFLLAIIVRRWLPKAHAWLVKYGSASFYIWAISLAIVTGQTVQSIAHSTDHILIEVGIGIGALAACIIQFWLGRRIGDKYQDKVSAGQSLGQKNTLLAIWMSYSYLNPLASVGPGSYVLWQNIINSYQLWKQKKKRKLG